MIVRRDHSECKSERTPSYFECGDARTKTGEAIAYLHDQERQGLQKFVGFVSWDHKPLLATLARQVGKTSAIPTG